MQRFASEIAQLRSLGFAEGLPIEPAGHSWPVANRLVSGRIGVVVEFLEAGSPAAYAVTSVEAHPYAVSNLTSDMWADVIAIVHQCAPSHDDD